MIRARGKGTWQVIVYAGRDADGNERRRVSRTVKGTKRAARTVERNLQLEVDGGHHQGDGVTVGELLATWLDRVAPELSPTTIAGYRRNVKLHVEPELGKVPLDRLTPARLDRLYTDLRTKKKLKPATIRQIHAVLRRALSQAVRWGWLVTNPAINASPPKLTRPDVRPPGRDDVARLLAALVVVDADFGTLCWLAAVTGARRGELCGLRWTDLDTTTGSLLIERAIVQIGAETLVKDTKTHQARRIALDNATLALLELHRARAVERADAAGITFTTDIWIFATPDGGHLSPMAVTGQYRRAAKTHGVSGRFHDLRHFVATQALAAGVDVRTVAGRLGHANPATTLNVYSHALAASDQRAAQLLGELVAAPEITHA